MSNFQRTLRWIALTAAMLAFLCGLSVMVGWWVGYKPLVKLPFAKAPMQFNTALAFLLCGASVFACLYRCFRIATVISGSALLLGGLTFLQYFTMLDFRIDQLFVDAKANFDIEELYPGRMAPNTALCFVLAGCSLFFFSLERWRDQARKVVGIVSSLIWGISLVALMGYVVEMETAYSWGELNQMSPQTTVGMNIISIAMICMVWKQSIGEESKVPEWMPIVVLIGCLTFSVCLWLALITQEEKLIRLGGHEVGTITDEVALVIGVLISFLVMYSLRTAIESSKRLELYKNEVRKQATTVSELREAKQRFELAFKGTNDGLWDWFDVNREEQWWSPKFYELLEYENNEIPSSLNTFKELLHPDDHSPTFAAITDAFENDIPFDVEYRLKVKSGDYRVFRGRALVLRDDKGVPCRMAGSLQDTTAIHLSRESLEQLVDKRTEDLRTTNEELMAQYYARTEAEKEARDLYNNAPDMMLSVEPKSRTIIQCNQTLLLELGYTEDEVIGKPLLDFYHPDCHEGVRMLVEQFYETGIIRNIPLIVRKKDGNYIHVTLNSSAIRDENGEIIASRSIWRDVTEEKQAQDELDQYRYRLEELVEQRTQDLEAINEELKRSNKELEQFAYIASHDLQEPLRKIQVFGEMLKEDYSDKLDEEGKEIITRISSASSRMERLIEDLLSFSRVSMRKDEFVEIDLNDVFQYAMETYEFKIRDYDATIECDPLPVIAGDKSQMQQLFNNLIGNSLKYRKEGRPPVITITSESLEDDGIRITFADNGIGFEQEYAERIFGVFQRLHGRNEFQGTGIGLAICRKIVERHGGTITAEGKLDEGSTFIVNLPVMNVGKESQNGA